jgi:hypothetical protein
MFGDATFTMLSGPCALAGGGRCIGRPDGYCEEHSCERVSFAGEHCEIAVAGAGGFIGACPVYTTHPWEG